MVDKNTIDPLGTPDDDGSFSQIQNEFEECYRTIIDSSYFALGRNVTLHLVPEKLIDTDGAEASTPAVHYNSFQRRGRRVPSQISTTRSPAVKITHRDVTYQAHIKHGPKGDDDKGGIALLDGEVQLTTLIASHPHIRSALTATIDGMRYKLEWARPIGFQEVRYLISKWKIINEVQNG